MGSGTPPGFGEAGLESASMAGTIVGVLRFRALMLLPENKQQILKKKIAIKKHYKSNHRSSLDSKQTDWRSPRATPG